MGAGANMGYGYVAVNLIKAWQHYYEIPVWWGDKEAPVSFSYTQPYFYDYEYDRINIGYTPWESTKVPDSWLMHMDKMTQIWTTSNACKDWFLNAGLNRLINVLPHGINRKHYPAVERRLDNSTSFTFLHVGGDAKRKGALLVYECFKDLFKNHKEYQLVLKGNVNFDVEGDNVKVISSKLSQDQLTQLYLDSHAMIYPTMGEGFGLIPFQAMASGMPTAVTDWGGPQDFIEYGHPLKVKDLIDCDYEPHEGQWALVDPIDIKDHMEAFVNASDFYFKLAYRDALRMDDDGWLWKDIALKALDMMQQIK